MLGPLVAQCSASQVPGAPASGLPTHQLPSTPPASPRAGDPFSGCGWGSQARLLPFPWLHYCTTQGTWPLREYTLHIVPGLEVGEGLPTQSHVTCAGELPVKGGDSFSHDIPWNANRHVHLFLSSAKGKGGSRHCKGAPGCGQGASWGLSEREVRSQLWWWFCFRLSTLLRHSNFHSNGYFICILFINM